MLAFILELETATALLKYSYAPSLCAVDGVKPYVYILQVRDNQPNLRRRAEQKLAQEAPFLPSRRRTRSHH
jgi:hypothetical protein